MINSRAPGVVMTLLGLCHWSRALITVLDKSQDKSSCLPDCEIHKTGPTGLMKNQINPVKLCQEEALLVFTTEQICLTFGLHALFKATLMADAEFGECYSITFPPNPRDPAATSVLHASAKTTALPGVYLLIISCEKGWLKKLLYSWKCWLISLLWEKSPSLIQIKSAV